MHCHGSHIVTLTCRRLVVWCVCQVTTQRCCVRGVSPSQLFRAAEKIRGVKVGDLRYDTKGVRLGELDGNRCEWFVS